MTRCIFYETGWKYGIMRRFRKCDVTLTSWRALQLVSAGTCVLILYHLWNGKSDIKDISREVTTSEDAPIWTRISDSVFVYSAYLDKRPIVGLGSSLVFPIRILGLWKLPDKKRLLRNDPLRWFRIKEESLLEGYFCKVFYATEVNKGGDLTFFEGQKLTRQIFEEGLKIYAGTFFNCYINRTWAELVKGSVSVAVYPMGLEGYPVKLIEVKVVGDLKAQVNPGLTLCLRPMFGPWENVGHLEEFLAYYKTMGVTGFHLYDFSVSAKVKAALEKRRSEVFFKRWNLPTGNWEELWDYGSLTSANDCLYRNMDKKWVIFVDLDEFMVPQGSTAVTLVDVLASNFSECSQLVVRNTFFCKEFCPPSAKPCGSSIFDCWVRTKRIWPTTLRTKFFVQPKHVLQVGHHQVTKFTGSLISRRRSSTCFAPATILILNHYRRCAEIALKVRPILNSSVVRDYSLLKYRSNVTEILMSR